MQHPSRNPHQTIFAKTTNLSNTQVRTASPFHKYDSKCVCQICNCRRHWCPSDYDNQGKIVPLSHHDYRDFGLNDKNYPMNPAQRYIPINADRDHFKTTNQMNYQPQETSKKTPKRGPSRGDLPRLPGYYNSEYQNGIGKLKDPKDLATSHNTGLQERPYTSQPFATNSTYRDHYKGNPGDFKPFKKNNQPVDFNTPMDCKTIYRQEYIKRPFDPNNPTKEREAKLNYRNLEKPVSLYGTSYPLYGPECYMKGDCPINIMPKRPARCSPGKSHLYYHDEPQHWD